jgi:hypothetical protein
MSATRASPVGLGWILTRRALNLVAADPVAREILAAGHIFELTPAGQELVPGIEAERAMSFGSYRSMAEALDAGLPAGTRALLYDPEHWQFTPLDEQLDVGGYVSLATDLAHSRGLTLIAAPAVNLTKALGPAPRGWAPAPVVGTARTGRAAPVAAGRRQGTRSQGGWLARSLRGRDRYDDYLDCGLASLAAPADHVVVQAQNAERDHRRYARFVEAAVGQVKEVNQRAIVLAGVSTNPPGDPVTVRQLAAAIESVLQLVDGFWLNVPSPGPHCPTCNPARPDIGIAALRAVFA